MTWRHGKLNNLYLSQLQLFSVKFTVYDRAFLAPRPNVGVITTSNMPLRMSNGVTTPRSLALLLIPILVSMSAENGSSCAMRVVATPLRLAK